MSNSLHVERWPFSANEEANPQSCNRNDSLTCSIHVVNIDGIVLGSKTVDVNRLGNPQPGIQLSKKQKLLVAMEEEYLHEDGETTLHWRDVLVDSQGNFQGWST